LLDSLLQEKTNIFIFLQWMCAPPTKLLKLKSESNISSTELE